MWVHGDAAVIERAERMNDDLVVRARVELVTFRGAHARALELRVRATSTISWPRAASARAYGAPMPGSLR